MTKKIIIANQCMSWLDVQASRDIQREDSAQPHREIFPATPPLTQKARTSSRQSGQSTPGTDTPTSAQTPRPQAPVPPLPELPAEASPAGRLSTERSLTERQPAGRASYAPEDKPQQQLPQAMAEEVMARLARRLPEVNLNVRTSMSRSGSSKAFPNLQ